jgi:hypothetical protein
MSKNRISKDERAEFTLVQIIVGVCVALFFLFGLVIKPEGAHNGIDIEYLWDAFHPFTFWDGLGTFLFLFFAVTVSGILRRFLPDDLVSGNGLSWACWGAGAFGVVLIFTC